MSNIIYSMTASKESAMDWESWNIKYQQKMKRGINDDIIKMNAALAEDGVSSWSFLIKYIRRTE